MPTYRFREVPLYAKKNVTCAGADCTKKVRRQRKFTQTLNPFNKGADGRPKDVPQIMAELQKKATVWEQTPELCSSCAQAPAEPRQCPDCGDSVNCGSHDPSNGEVES